MALSWLPVSNMRRIQDELSIIRPILRLTAMTLLLEGLCVRPHVLFSPDGDPKPVGNFGMREPADKEAPGEEPFVEALRVHPRGNRGEQEVGVGPGNGK